MLEKDYMIEAHELVKAIEAPPTEGTLYIVASALMRAHRLGMREASGILRKKEQA